MVKIDLSSYRPKLKADYIAWVTKVYGAMVADLGDNLKHVQNSPTWARTYANVVRDNVTTLKADNVFDLWPKKILNEQALETNGEAYAAATIGEWQAKIESKLEKIEDVEVKDLNNCRFAISGTRAGRKIFIDQDMIINTSSRGTLFNQFPARIYVDGKFTSEKNYKLLFA